MLNGKTILITGGTGSFGKHCRRKILQQCDPKMVIIFYRDELKQSEMAADLTFASGKFRFFLDHNNCVPSPSPLGQGSFKTLDIRALRDKI